MRLPDDIVNARIAPASSPYPPQIQAQLDRLTPPGKPVLSLFTLVARDPRLFQRLMGASLLDKGHLTLRRREIVIGRITARGGCEYEWGVHVALFGAKAGFDDEQTYSLVHGGADDPCWTDAVDRILIRSSDALHDGCNLPRALWDQLSAKIDEPAILEVLMLAGFYRTITYLANATELPPEPFAPRFPPKR
jgi:alkylhydroperoxidase family enzyme